MFRGRHTRTVNIFVWLLAVMLLASGAAAKAPSQSSSVGDSELAYGHQKEITVVGTIERLVTHSAPGGAPGFHLIITTAGKTVDAHLGPFLSKQNQEALVTGQPVQIVGTMTRMQGNDFLLARQLIFGGRLVTVRNERGALARGAHPARRAAVRSTTGGGKPVANGGVQ